MVGVESGAAKVQGDLAPRQPVAMRTFGVKAVHPSLVNFPGSMEFVLPRSGYPYPVITLFFWPHERL